MAVRVGFDVGSDTVKTVIIKNDGEFVVLPIASVQGQPLRRVEESLRKVKEIVGDNTVICGVTGGGAASLKELIGADSIHEPNALAAAFQRLYPEVRTVIEMGRETQKYILFEKDPVSGKLLVEDLNLGNKCASGSGSFLDHMSKRLNYADIGDFARVAYDIENPASLSGRCAVFTESDIVHLYQKGTPRERIAAGIHQAISRNYRSAIARGKEFVDVVAFIGGVSENPTALKYLTEELGINGRVLVPEHNRTLGAIGSAMQANKTIDLDQAIAALDEHLSKPLDYPGCDPIKMVDSEIMPRVEEKDIPTEIERAGLGVDIGSVSTKAALVAEINGRFVVLADYYRKTDGDPLAAVSDTLIQINKQVEQKGLKIGKIAAATTGSGRYLTGDYIGADLIRNEITAQASGARAYADDVDTIFEIGGQDSKYVRMDGDVIIDFEMNKACAAGTGAFLEKQAGRLGIPLEDFGDTALLNTRPPDLDWTCTVFSESAMVFYQQNNVPKPDLAAGICLASVKNYLHKNVASRSIGKKVAFQGAVAFNKGMVAAYETVLGRKIVVPPYPHITGAVGAARLAYIANPEQSKFRGFDAVAKTKYKITSFECKACANRCDVNTFEMEDGPKYFYNDRCEKYSAVQKKALGSDLPDLFAERHELMMNIYQSKVPDGAPTMGIPRGLMFTEFFPLYNAFFSELGFKVVPSDDTNKRIVTMGLETSIGEPCFPFKVAHGHHMDLVEKGVDAIFSPGIINTDQPNSNLRQAQTCPYLQGAPDVINSAIGITERGIRLFSPRIQFKRGRKHVERIMIEVASQLDKNPAEAKKAFAVAWDTHLSFRKKIEERGTEVVQGISKDQMAFVVIGRPYTLYDPVINMHIGKKIQDMGILAIPQDYLPLEAVDISDTWPNAYSRQIQRKLMAARLIRQDVRLRAVVLTFFACGPDSFGNPFFRDEINEPCYVMQIDEHTADAGVITRIEAFADTAGRSVSRESEIIRSQDASVMDMTDRLVWIPYLSEGARSLAASMRAYGINAHVLPQSPDPGFNLARSAISEDVCLPALATTEDIMFRTQQPEFDPAKEAFFQGNAEGPCRYGMYSMLQRRILDTMGFYDTPVVTLGAKSEHGGLGILFALVTYNSMLFYDLLLKMVTHVRPYEITPGASDTLLEKYMTRMEEMLPQHKIDMEASILKTVLGSKHLEPLADLLHEAQMEFAAIPKRNEDKPIVGMVGEFYVRLHDRANQDVIRKLESEGAEVWLAPMTEFFTYVNHLAGVLSKERMKDGVSIDEIKTYTASWFNEKLASKSEHKLFEATLPLLDGYDDIAPSEIIRNGTMYLDYNFGGEAICSMGKSEDFAKRGIAGILSVLPFNCMPGNTVTALSQSLRRRHDNIPFLNLDYDGFTDSGREAKIINFMWQVKERFLGRKGALDTEEVTEEQSTVPSRI